MWSALRTEWHELGWVGRLAGVGVLLSLAIAVTLGFSIPASAKRHLLHAQTDIMSSVAAELSARGLIPGPDAAPGTLELFDGEVRLRLLGGETVRVKVWAPDGTILYSDAPGLIGRRFELSGPAREAMAGRAASEISPLDDPAHELERDLGELIEFYIPIRSDAGEVVGAFEVEQRTDALDATVGRIRANVWLSIITGLAVLTVFMAALALAGARAANRRGRQAERLLGDVLRAREDERRHIVGALHGDVGQPLYRVLYGLEGSRSKVDDPDVRAELGRLEELVRRVDGTLRAELKLLHRSEVEDIGLTLALEELAALTRDEADLAVGLAVEDGVVVAATPAQALFWAAEEGLVNARKHSGASRVDIRLGAEPGRIVLEVADDGAGVSSPEGLGLVTVRERLGAIGGGLRLERRPGGGTILRAWVPASGEEAR